MNRRSQVAQRIQIGPFTGRFVWGTHDDPAAGAVGVGGIPAGLQVAHPGFPYPHSVTVLWAHVGLPSGAPHFVFQLDSLVPLTVVEPIACTICGVVGRIERGAWVPAESGGAS